MSRITASVRCRIYSEKIVTAALEHLMIKQEKSDSSGNEDSDDSAATDEAQIRAKKAINKGRWSKDEDTRLKHLVDEYQERWEKIAEYFPDRSDVQCQQRWTKVVNPELVKGPWTKEEDEKVKELVKKYGPKKWTLIARHLKGRIGKQCRERWHNHLDPNINKSAWTEQEDRIIYQAHKHKRINSWVISGRRSQNYYPVEPTMRSKITGIQRCGENMRQKAEGTIPKRAGLGERKQNLWNITGISPHKLPN
ncbi:Myb-like DNA-binding domain [Popillia japonica]|uniref:Myb-like DNA-binding domain n=1 Tax=Popillia japonica TaxID=7064 RepID=A0AAW1IFM2_POPJA